MKRILPIVSALALASAWAVAQTPEKELESAKEAFAADQNKYYEMVREKAARGEMVDMTASPAKEYLAKALAIAGRAKGTKVADDAYGWAVTLAYQSNNPEALAEAVEGMIANNPNSPELKQSMTFIGYGIRDQAKAIKLLSRIEHFSGEPEIKAQAIAARAALFYDDYSGTGDVPRAKSIFNRVLQQYPGTEAAKRAKNVLFAMDNLSVGKLAPDFSATDQDGISFKLSDYRGRVVVVAFWGFW